MIIIIKEMNGMGEENIVLSLQEKRILEQQILKKSSSDSNSRVNKILNSFKGERPKIDIKRAKYFTESFKETEGELLILRWSKALLHYAKNATIYRRQSIDSW